MPECDRDFLRDSIPPFSMDDHFKHTSISSTRMEVIIEMIPGRAGA
jgi:hypothetical protein